MIQDPSLHPPPPIPDGLTPGTVVYIRCRIKAFDMEVRGETVLGVIHNSVLVIPIDKAGKEIDGEWMTFLPESVVQGAVVVREMKGEG